MPKNEILYKHYDQESLDRQYNNRLNVPDHEVHTQNWERLSRETEKAFAPFKGIPFGNLSGEILDIFPSKTPHSKVLVFIHGGYWYKHQPSDFHFVAKAFEQYGITTVLIGYPLMPENSMEQLVSSCGKAITWITKNISEFGGDPDQLYVVGHSAGGHLALSLAAEFSDKKFPMTAIKGFCGISGLYNLRPVQLSNVNQFIGITPEEAKRNSPLNLQPAATCRMILAYGEKETAEYHDQSRELFLGWTEKGAKIELLEIQDANHFSIVETMLDRTSPLHVSLRRLLEISIH